MSRVTVIICGAAGRMGARLLALAATADDLALTGAIERPGHPALGRDAGEVAGMGPLQLPLTDDLEQVAGRADVLLDFTVPEATHRHVETAVRLKKPMVIGTTGLGQETHEAIRRLALVAPVVQSPNMSIGVNLCFKVLAEMAGVLGEAYDVEITEVHHRQKQDAPSGTALRMARVIAEALGWELDQVAVYGRQGQTGERGHREIGIQAIRAGEIVGEHTVLFGGPGEVIELTHRALSRDTFARGALRAAAWVCRRPPGLYDMVSVLGLQ